MRWAAPESLNPSYVFDIRCDVWSFGIVMFETFTFGSTPYEGRQSLKKKCNFDVDRFMGMRGSHNGGSQSRYQLHKTRILWVCVCAQFV